jgi:hypothetical protein
MFVVNLPVRPHVKRYLENQCGFPVDLSLVPNLQKIFLKSLQKPDYRNEYRINFNKYSEKTEILISGDIFYRYGWELSRTDTIGFNLQVEKLIKFYSRSYISVQTQLGVSVAQAIRDFQEKFDLPEDVLKYDTIKKDYDRNGSRFDGKIFIDIQSKIHNIFMAHLSDLGTLAPNFVKS